MMPAYADTRPRKGGRGRGELVGEAAARCSKDSLRSFAISQLFYLHIWGGGGHLECRRRRPWFRSVAAVSMGILVSIPLRSSGPQPLWRLAARLRQIFGIGRFSIATDTWNRGSNPSLTPNSKQQHVVHEVPDLLLHAKCCEKKTLPLWPPCRVE